MGLIAKRMLAYPGGDPFRETLRYGTGELQKQNPLPAGRYWIDIFEKGQERWDGWVFYASGSGGLYPSQMKVLKTEAYEGDEDAGYESRNWILFETYGPLDWPLDQAKIIGWPSIAPANIQTSDDTVQKPQGSDIWHDMFYNNAGNVDYLKTALWIGGAGVAIFGIYSVAKLVRG